MKEMDSLGNADKIRNERNEIKNERNEIRNEIINRIKSK
jgi:hypothetical protein